MEWTRPSAAPSQTFFCLPCLLHQFLCCPPIGCDVRCAGQSGPQCLHKTVVQSERAFSKWKEWQGSSVRFGVSHSTQNTAQAFTLFATRRIESSLPTSKKTNIKSQLPTTSARLATQPAGLIQTAWDSVTIINSRGMIQVASEDYRFAFHSRQSLGLWECGD